ncbi:unnamed protein product [marine sediment metagenome]|uniref:Uncharacterized protein n=1 Tax=marine sediment metagenome TaxID=412755 RepID=X1EIW7_9ZZZZ
MKSIYTNTPMTEDGFVKKIKKYHFLGGYLFDSILIYFRYEKISLSGYYYLLFLL